MSAKNIIFHDKKINKNNFYRNKKLFKIDDIDINKVLDFKRESYGKKGSFKYFIGYNNNDGIRPLCIRLPQTIGFITYFKDGNKNVF